MIAVLIQLLATRAPLAQRRIGCAADCMRQLRLAAQLGGEGLQPSLPPLCATLEIDLIVSVNLLPQLPIRPIERLENAVRHSAHGGRTSPKD